MAIIKCKMCGGDVELTPDKTFGTCEYCGCSMTFPKVDDEQRASAFNRGNHFRRIGEFDKALAVYERIVREDDTDAEAHWCCALCRFGIEYVEDPVTFEYLPTCHRASFDSFLEDVDYLAAVEYSEGITKRQYQKDAVKIAEVQRGILATSQNEDPFDVFICYKESDENGQRTKDSLMAQDVYYQLTDQGYRVFFARITLEDLVGKQYEPYIFAALNSAKVMVVIGTKPEYMNAVWVKNEWSRFLSMMKKDRSKLLLPCYRDMDPYDMPEQLTVLQSYDMSKIGFIQDLIRGIKKVLDVGAQTGSPAREATVLQQATSNAIPLLKRGYISIEDKEWKKADELFEEVLNLDPECAQAYLGKFFVHEEVQNLDELVRNHLDDSEESEIEEIEFQETETQFEEEKALFVDELVSQYSLEGYISEGAIRKLLNMKPLTYQSAVKYREEMLEWEEKYWAENRDLNRALKYADPQLKKQITDARDLAVQTEKDRLEQAIAEVERSKNDLKYLWMHHKEAMVAEAKAQYVNALSQREADYEKKYNSACKSMNSANTQEAYRQAKNLFIAIHDYKDSMEKAKYCRQQEEVFIAQKLAQKQKNESLQKEYSALVEERNQLGFFSGKRRAEIDNRMMEIKKELRQAGVYLF